MAVAALLYGSKTYGITKKQEKTIEASEMKLVVRGCYS